MPAEYECALCNGTVVQVDEGKFICRDCGAAVEIPFEHKGEMHFVREDRNIPGLFLPGISVIPAALAYFDIGPVAWMKLLAIIFYLFVDAAMWSFRLGLPMLGRSVATRLVIMAIIGIGYWVWSRFG